ncbi:MAG: nitroreductase family deazaflavin-dependent oxidoreductase [Pseudomonadales bacterium]|nr:nitroreductase family deazaflavin-dependent oxidoreductase [Pseudomonadales bacterium]
MTAEKTYKPWSAGQEKFGKRFIKRIGKWQTFVYEKTNGKLWNTFLGAPCAILTTIGRKSGEPRKTPLLYMREGNDVVMVASQGGFSTMPLWYRNIQANPEVSIQIGAEKRQMRAREASESEKTLLWPKLDAIYEGYKEYRARTEGIRDIPILIFSAID